MIDLTIPRRLFDQAAEDASLDEDYLYPDYSGRGMYGATCPGIQVASHREVYAFFAALGGRADHATLHPTALVGLALSTSYDQLGRGLIAYWPGLELTEEPA